MSLIDKYSRIKQVAGVSVHLQSDGQMQIQCCSIAAEGNKLDIEKRLIDVALIERLKDHLTSKTIIALNVSGKGVLQKQIEQFESIDETNFSKILPNGNINDFYIQNFESGEFSFVSIIRRTEADRIIDQLDKMGFSVLMLSLGPFPVDNILPQLNLYEGNIIFDGHIINRDDKKNWLSYQYSETIPSPFKIKIESETINEKLFIAYAVAFQLVLANQLEVIGAQASDLTDRLQQRLKNNKLKAQGCIILLAFFILLLINFIVFSWVNSSNTRLLNQASLSNQSAVTVQQLNEQIHKKEALLHTVGWENGMDKSALIDQVCSLLPEEITLTEITVNPIDQAESRVQRSLLFYIRRIQITGTSDKIIPVNEWVARVKIKNWVKKINLESYTFDNELNTGRFLITIDY